MPKKKGGDSPPKQTIKPIKKKMYKPPVKKKAPKSSMRWAPGAKEYVKKHPGEGLPGGYGGDGPATTPKRKKPVRKTIFQKKR